MAAAGRRIDRTFAYTRVDETRRDQKMIDSGHMLDVLFGKANALWRRETQHEAMLLMTALYKADAEAREQISSAILAGPL